MRQKSRLLGSDPSVVEQQLNFDLPKVNDLKMANQIEKKPIDKQGNIPL
jgi:hypothetical protein